MTQIYKICKWSTLFLFLLLPACVNHVKIPDSAQKHIDNDVVQKTLWLKQSLYAGQFYDDDRYQLLFPRPFEELKYVKTVDGDYILPPAAKEIIPAGSKVVITKIEWPSRGVIFNRPILSPRNWPWIYLRVARDRGPVTTLRDSTYIMILPENITDEKSFNQWKKSYLDKEDPNEWLLSYEKNILFGILHKKPVLGMDYQALMATLGQPNHLKKELITLDNQKITKETATYDAVIVILENGLVSKIEKLP